jgi:hypothetical protein
MEYLLSRLSHFVLWIYNIYRDFMQLDCENHQNYASHMKKTTKFTFLLKKTFLSNQIF